MTDSVLLLQKLYSANWKNVLIHRELRFGYLATDLLFDTDQGLLRVRGEAHMIKRPDVTTRAGDDIFSLWIEEFDLRNWWKPNKEPISLSDRWRGESVYGLMDPPREVRFYTESDFDYPILYPKDSVLKRCVALEFTSHIDEGACLLLTAEQKNVGVFTGGEAQVGKDYFIEYEPEGWAE